MALDCSVDKQKSPRKFVARIRLLRLSHHKSSSNNIVQSLFTLRECDHDETYKQRV